MNTCFETLKKNIGLLPESERCEDAIEPIYEYNFSNLSRLDPNSIESIKEVSTIEDDLVQ